MNNPYSTKTRGFKYSCWYNGFVHKFIYQLKTLNPDLKPSELEGLLYLLLSSDKVSNNKHLIYTTGLPKETLKIFKSSVSSLLRNPGTEDLILNEVGLKLLKEVAPTPYKWHLFEYSNEETQDLEAKFLNLAKKYNLHPKRDYDQFFAKVHTSISKALLIKDKVGLEDKSIGLLGDDDLVSVCLALLGVTFRRLVIFDIDQELLTAIEGMLKELNIKNFQTVKYDCRNELKPDFFHRFDIITTDPPYTQSGIKLFLNRSLQLLEKTSNYEGKYIFLFHGTSFKTPEKTLKIQEIINKYNLIVEEKFNKFAQYDGAESIGSTSSAYVLKTTAVTEPLNDAELPQNIYTNENQKEEKFPYVSHYVFKLVGVNPALLDSKSKMLAALKHFCMAHRLKVVDTKITPFERKGLSFTLILSTSNLLTHTWPEYNALHLDLLVCSPIYNAENLPNTLQSIFKADNIEHTQVE